MSRMENIVGAFWVVAFIVMMVLLVSFAIRVLM